MTSRKTRTTLILEQMEYTIKRDVPSAESPHSVRGLGKGVSGKPYPRLCNARRPRLEPKTFRSQAVKLYRLHQARPSFHALTLHTKQIGTSYLINPYRCHLPDCKYSLLAANERRYDVLYLPNISASCSCSYTYTVYGGISFS